MSWDRKLGKYGILYVGTEAGGSTLFDGADLYNIEVDIESDTEELEGLDDRWGQPKPRVFRWNVRAEKWVTTQQFLNLVKQFIDAGDALYCDIYRGDDAAVGTLIVRGQVAPSRASFRIPNAGMNEDLELVGIGEPTTVATD